MRKKTTILLIGVVLLAAVLTAGCTFNVGNTTPSASPTNTYDSAKGFTINYPSNWTKDEPTSGPLTVLFGTPTNNATENLNVQVSNTSGETLSDLTARLTSQLQNFSDFKQTDAGNTTLAGNPAYKVIYTATVDGSPLKLTQIWTVKDGKEYIITYKGAPNNYDTYLSAAQQMVDSFQIK